MNHQKIIRSKQINNTHVAIEEIELASEYAFRYKIPHKDTEYVILHRMSPNEFAKFESILKKGDSNKQRAQMRV